MRNPASDFLSPVVRRLLAEHDLDPSELTGSGADGRVTRADVLSAVAARERTPQHLTTASAPRVVPFSAMRKRIAEHMARSVATSPHAFCSVIVDFEAVDRVRRAHAAEWRANEGFTLTSLPFVARAIVDALRDHPLLNASIAGDELVVHPTVHLGIAVDLDREGLVVPVVRDADVRRLRGIAREAAGLARRARARQLSPDDLTGGTITITNPGALGTIISVPIINQPQIAIVVMDRVRRAPVVTTLPDGSDGIAMRAVATLGLSFDHRAVDVAYAAAFLDATRRALETRDWTSEL